MAHICSSCYLREVPEAGVSCPRCHDWVAHRQGRRVRELLRRAAAQFEVATDAIQIGMEQEDVRISLQEVMRADAASMEAWEIVQAAQEVVFRMAAIHTETAVAARAELIHALERAGEVVNLVGNALTAVASRLAA
ncbi:hypothetical protein B0H65DRAFT_436959 [Neurospora tetraspora]|uniref:Uncharacterized protein n=1 Tax=Neurospora tetraspora TaxID=94610 RepID=A0AAE0J157_9PEZI|nr:hypothetical protein B0H65DRAFT_436959 [Neurospora tetraspora]